MTNEQFTSWLKSPSAIRCVLMEVKVEVGGVETTRYLSNKGYTTGGSDVPAHTAYSPIIVGGVQFTESISLDGSVSLSFGDIELQNSSGERDAWLNDVWKNRDVSVFIGDVRWPRSDFRQIFNGIVADIGTRRQDRLNISLTDKLQRLNTPVTESKLGGESQNKDRLLPLTFGEVHNIAPLLTDEALHEYQVHDGPIQSIIEVRDEGVPVEFTPLLSIGKFRLNQQPAGNITCSVQGDKPSGVYSNKVADLVKRVVTSFGSSIGRFTDSDIDLTNFTTFNTDNPQPVGIYLDNRTNTLEVCSQLAGSVGAALSMNREGLLRLVKIALPTASGGVLVTSSDIVKDSLQVAMRPPVVASVKLGYCKNYEVQTDLQTGIPAAHKALFEQEYLTVTKMDSTVAAKYKLFTEPSMVETLLLTEADANAEAQRRLDLYKTQRTVYKFTALPHLMFESTGNALTIEHWRYGLDVGKSGQIASLTTNWLNPRIDMEVLT